MRDINRIDKFLNEIGTIWKTECPDWRFGQFIVNIYGTSKIDPFFLEEDDSLKLFKEFFEIEDNEDGKDK